MRRLLSSLIVFAALAAVLPAKPLNREIVWTDAATLPLYGKVNDSTSARYERLPAKLEGVLREGLWKDGLCSAGMYIRFRTASPAIYARWSTARFSRMSHQALTGTRGLDLYGLKQSPKGGSWRYIRTVKPSFREKEVEAPLAGIPATDKPVVIYGTSIMQGGCVSRPGMSITAILTRRLNREVINLGFSGQAHLDGEIAEWMARTKDPGVFILDYESNASKQEIEERGERFFRILRDAHPKVPVIFVEHSRYPFHDWDGKAAAARKGRDEANRALYGKLKKNGERLIWYVTGEHLIGDDAEGTVEGIHWNELGTTRYCDVLEPVIRKALAKNKL